MARRKTRMARVMAKLRTQNFKRWSRVLPLVAVAGVALYVSYWHIRDVAAEHGSDPVSAAILPFSVDGLVIVAVRYVEAKTRSGKAFAWAAFGLGVLATLAGNVLAAPPDDPIGLGVAVWPAVAVVVTGLVLHRGEAKPKAQRRAQPATAPVAKPARRERVAKARESVTA